MIKIDNDIKNLKLEVLERVAKLAFDGDLDADHLAQIPFEMIPTTRPRFRCCVFKEREILSQRTRMATGKLPTGVEDHGAVISVIPSACEGCPINRYRVTENCQRCLAKKCQEACPFGAISMTGKGAYIDPDKCRECGRCAQACPYNAIADLVRPCKRSCPVGAISIQEDKVAVIEQDKCISCGACMRDCPFGAISDRSQLAPLIERILGPKPVVAIFAPALEGQFGPNVPMGKLKSAALQLGFAAAYEVAMGADGTAQAEGEELLEVLARGGKMTTSCCPAFVNMVRKHYPQLQNLVSTTASPMLITARLVRRLHPNCAVAFFGPCVAKKTETGEEGSPEFLMTAEEFYAMLQARGINPETCEDAEQDGSVYAKGFAQSGGVTGAVLRSLEEKGVEMPAFTHHHCDGAAECKKALALLASDKSDVDFLEGMACEGGCVAGPAGLLSGRLFRQARTKLLAKADKRDIRENTARVGLTPEDAHRPRLSEHLGG